MERRRSNRCQMNHRAERAARVRRLIRPMRVQQMRRTNQQHQQHAHHRNHATKAQVEDRPRLSLSCHHTTGVRVVPGNGSNRFSMLTDATNRRSRCFPVRLHTRRIGAAASCSRVLRLALKSSKLVSRTYQWPCNFATPDKKNPFAPHSSPPTVPSLTTRRSLSPSRMCSACPLPRSIAPFIS